MKTPPFEDDLREMLERRARDFEMPARLAPIVRRRVAQRLRRVALLAGATVIAVGVTSWAGVALRSPRPVPSPNAAQARPALRSVRYVLADSGSSHNHGPGNPGHEATEHQLRDHARCMRSQGFDVPDPTHHPDGWSILIEDPATRGLDLDSPAFREAMFVTCGSVGGPLSGSFVMGGTHERIERFMSCMREEGFDFPEPTRVTSGGSEGENWEFDLTGTSIDMSAPEWNRAVFVRCGPATRV